MNSIRVRSTGKLCGEIEVQGCKNAVLPILAATLLNEKTNVIHNCPKLSDVADTIEIINSLGAKATLTENTVVVESSGLNNYVIPQHLMGKLRSSIIFAACFIPDVEKPVLSNARS